MKGFIISVILVAWLSPISARSYMEKAEAFSSDSLSRHILNGSCTINWTGNDCRHFWYYTETAEGKDYFLADTRTWKKTRMFDTEELLEKLNSLAPPASRFPN